MTKSPKPAIGSAPPTMEDVAKIAGVSRALVSLVFREPEKVSTVRRERVIDAARSVGFAPNYFARKLASVDTRSVGVLVSDIHNPFFMGVVNGIQDAAEGTGYDLLFGLSHNNPAQDLRSIRQFQQHRLSGVIVVTSAMDLSALTSELHGLPTVFSGVDATEYGITSVMNDEREGARLACEHLYQLGHRRIVYVGGGDNDKADMRAKVFREVSNEFTGMQLTSIDGHFDESSGIRAAKEILEMPDTPTAVIAANDLSALGLLAVLRARGFAIPQELSLMGYDNSFVSALKVAELTTIAQPGNERGSASFRALTQELAGDEGRGRSILLPPSLVLRQTTTTRPQNSTSLT